MSVPLSAADVLGEHVVFELESIDRMYCNAYVRKLTYPGGVASFFTHHRGASFASTCLADPISKRFVASILDFAAEREIPVVRFLKGQRKDDIAHEHLARFDRARGDLHGRGGAGEDEHVPDREAPQPRDWGALSVDRARQRAGQPVLLPTGSISTSARSS